MFPIKLAGKLFTVFTPVSRTATAFESVLPPIRTIVLGEWGLYRVFWQMSVIAVFPQKTGDLMFVGFDSQNTSHSFPHYPNWNLWV